MEKNCLQEDDDIILVASLAFGKSVSVDYTLSCVLV